jgi:hypothetical protein
LPNRRTAKRAEYLGEDDRPSPWQPRAPGLTERPLFTAALLSGNAGFIAVWLALKTAASWSSWGVDHEGATRLRRISGREVYVNFMLGQALSLAFAASGAKVVTLLERQRLVPALLIMGATVIGTMAFGYWVRRSGRRYLNRVPPLPWPRSSSEGKQQLHPRDP